MRINDIEVGFIYWIRLTIAWPFKLMALILLFFAYLISFEDFDDTFGEWFLRHVS